MSDKSPYQLLGVAEDAAFEEIQAARDQLLIEFTADENHQEAIQQAYDLILMQRLRQRQEGKIAVPDRIRYAERVVMPDLEVNSPVQPSRRPLPTWIQRSLDRPTPAEALWIVGVLGALLVWGISAATTDPPSLPLAVGLLTSFIILFRKERRFFRAVVLSLLGLMLGVVLVYGVAALWSGPTLSAALLLGITFSCMGLVTAFLR